jgi:hypothetical protein
MLRDRCVMLSLVWSMPFDKLYSSIVVTSSLCLNVVKKCQMISRLAFVCSAKELDFNELELVEVKLEWNGSEGTAVIDLQLAQTEG